MEIWDSQFALLALSGIFGGALFLATPVWYFLLTTRSRPLPQRRHYGLFAALGGIAVWLLSVILVEAILRWGVPFNGPVRLSILSIVWVSCIFMPLMLMTAAIDSAVCKGYPLPVGVLCGLFSPPGLVILLLLPDIPNEELLEEAFIDTEPRPCEPPLAVSPMANFAARVAFGLATLGTCLFIGWFLYLENNSRGLSISTALLFIPVLLTLFGMVNVKRGFSTDDVRGIGWGALAFSLAGSYYLARSFPAWFGVAIAWCGLHMLVVLGIVCTRRDPISAAYLRSSHRPVVSPITNTTARIVFGVASLGSLLFLSWFCFVTDGKPGLSNGSSILLLTLLLLTLLLTLFGLSNITSGFSTGTVRAAGWMAWLMSLTGCYYFATYFPAWLVVAIIWSCLHLPVIVGVVSARSNTAHTAKSGPVSRQAVPPSPPPTARLAFGLAALGSFALCAWFRIAENDTSGMSIGTTLLFIPVLLNLFGVAYSKEGFGVAEVREAGWINLALTLGGCVYFALYFPAWIVFGILWTGLHIPIIAGVLLTPHKPTPPSNVKRRLR